MPQVSLDPGKFQFLPDMLLILHPQNFVAWKPQKHKNGLLGNFQLSLRNQARNFQVKHIKFQGVLFSCGKFMEISAKGTYVKSQIRPASQNSRSLLRFLVVLAVVWSPVGGV